MRNFTIILRSFSAACVSGDFAAVLQLDDVKSCRSPPACFASPSSPLKSMPTMAVERLGVSSNCVSNHFKTVKLVSFAVGVPLGGRLAPITV